MVDGAARIFAVLPGSLARCAPRSRARLGDVKCLLWQEVRCPRLCKGREVP